MPAPQLFSQLGAVVLGAVADEVAAGHVNDILGDVRGLSACKRLSTRLTIKQFSFIVTKKLN